MAGSIGVFFDPMSPLVRAIAFAVVFVPSLDAGAQAGGPPRPDADIGRRQQDERKRIEESATERPTQLTAPESVPPPIDLSALPSDTPCFVVRRLAWRNAPGEPDGAHVFPWLAKRLGPVQGQCIGKRALEAIQTAANIALIERGYLTSRVLIPEQSLASGVLTLAVIAGRVSVVRGVGIGWSRTVLPFYPGAIYNQRDVDQALESVRRLPGQGDTVLDVEPGAAPGESVIVLKPAGADSALPAFERKRWHAAVGIDNYGLDATGRYTLNGTFSFDSPLHLYDQLTVSGATNADWQSREHASHSAAVNWNVPLGYASLFVNASRSRYRLSVAGFEEPLRYTGDSAELNAGLAFVPFRSASARTNAQVKLYRRYNHAYLNDTSLDYQFRDTVGYEATLSQTQYVGLSVFSGGIGWRQTLAGVTRHPGAIVDEDAQNGRVWNGDTRVLTANAQALLPFAVGPTFLRYSAQFNVQHALTKLVPTDYFTIGTPYTVRGFDGQTTLAAESGWAWRNEIGMNVRGQTPFVALDAGQVSGPSARYLAGTVLVGAALGVRGLLPASSVAAIDYEATLGWPIAKPQSLRTGYPSLLLRATTRF